MNLKNNKNICIISSGGDSPGMNKLIYLLAKGLKENFTVFVGKKGFAGLHDDLISEVTDLSEYEKRQNDAGSIIGSSRFHKLNIHEEHTKRIRDNLFKRDIRRLIILGGDGSAIGGEVLSKLDLQVTIIPCSIDNDYSITELTIGALSAKENNQRLIYDLNLTAKTHDAINLVEAMGRLCPWLTHASVENLDPLLVIDNQNFRRNRTGLVKLIKKALAEKGRYDPVIIVQENLYSDESYRWAKEQLALELNIPLRITRLGYLQRGAPVCEQDLILAKKMSNAVIDWYIKNPGDDSMHIVIIDEKENIKIRNRSIY